MPWKWSHSGSGTGAEEETGGAGAGHSGESAETDMASFLHSFFLLQESGTILMPVSKSGIGDIVSSRLGAVDTPAGVWGTWVRQSESWAMWAQQPRNRPMWAARESRLRVRQPRIWATWTWQLGSQVLRAWQLGVG